MSLYAGAAILGVLMDTCGVGCVALGEAGPVGNMTVVDSPGQEVLNQLDGKTSSETTSTETSVEISLPTPLSGFEDSLDERKFLPEQESLSRLEQQGMYLSFHLFLSPCLA